MSLELVSIYIPYASYHLWAVHRAIESAARQTVACKVISGLSEGTPAHFRNQAKDADTPFIVFLDADDILAPTFVEACLRTYQTGRYVYTSWYCDSVLRRSNLCVDKDQDYHSHLITTLYPTAIFRALGGFDETLPGHEDVDFYLRSQHHGVCGLHLDKPLLNYTQHGQRSLSFNERADKKAIMDAVYLRNGGQQTIMACCGQAGTPAQINPGTQQPGDVLAETLWSGMHSEVGYATGRVYVGGNGSKIYVSPQDIELMPDKFRAVVDMSSLAPQREQVLIQAGLV